MKLPTRIPKRFWPYFWDVDAAKVSPSEKPLFVIQRLLDWNDFSAAKWVLKNFSTQKIKDSLTSFRGWSKRSQDFWEKYFGLKNIHPWTTQESPNQPSRHWNY